MGMAVATVVTVAEILKKNGLAAVTNIGTSTVGGLYKLNSFDHLVSTHA
jgi:hypothetical protein